MCYHRHTQPSLPDVLHIPSVVTHITPFRKGRLAILPSLAIFPSSTIHIHVLRYVRKVQVTSYMNYTKKYKCPQRVPAHVEGRIQVKVKDTPLTFIISDGSDPHTHVTEVRYAT